VTPPDNPPDGTTPITVVTPPDNPPDGTTPIIVVTPPGTGGPIPIIPDNPPPPDGGGPVGATGGVPEPQLWFELIAGFGLAGLALRRRPVAA
jgi:hypothetical protein